MKNTTGSSVSINESEISIVAYQMWEKAGRPDGRDWQFWLEAETQLRAAAQAAAARPVAPLSSGEARTNAVPKAGNLGIPTSQRTPAKPQQKVTRF